MKKTITLFLVIFSLLSLKAQEELIRNGDFSQGETSESVKDIAFWNMDMETPGSGWWNQHVGMVSSDTSLYQVVETITADSVLYTCTFLASNPWQTDKILVTASITQNDSTIRTKYASKAILTTEPYEFKFGFSEGSVYAGKKLVIEIDIIPHDTAIAKSEASWCDIDNISLKKVIPGVNTVPVAVTGAPQTVRGGDLVTLDGSASHDVEGTELDYTWGSLYPGIIFSDRHSVNPTFIAPDVTELTTFEFTLVVSDGEFDSELVITTVTVTPAGELIRNGGFEVFTEGSSPSSVSLKDVAFWNIDNTAALSGGRWGNAGLKQATLASIDPTFYQVVKTIGSVEATYNLSFSARSSWNSISLKSIFSVSDADSTIRTQIDSKDAVFEIDVPNGISTSTSKVFTHVLVIPANSPNVGKKLILEFDNIPYEDGTDNGWVEMDNVSLIETLASSVRSDKTASMSIYPNPASDRIYIQSRSIISKVEIYSVLGKLEKTIENPDIRLVELGNISKGLHFISLTTNNGVITKKFQVK